MLSLLNPIKSTIYETKLVTVNGSFPPEPHEMGVPSDHCHGQAPACMCCVQLHELCFFCHAHIRVKCQINILPFFLSSMTEIPSPK